MTPADQDDRADEVDEFARQHWSLDKRVPLALIVTMAIQTAAAIWWAAGLNSTVTYLTERLRSTEHRLDRAVEDGREADKRVVRIEEQIKAVLDTVRRIDGKLDGPGRAERQQ